jgi:hypothetical protein
MPLTRRARATSLATGVLLMMLAAMGAAIGVQPVYGQEDDFGGDEGGDVGEEEPMDEEAPPVDEVDTQDLEVTETAIYAHPVTDSLPKTVTESVPPQAVCVVRPELCPEGLRPVTGIFEDAIATMQDEAPSTPIAPVMDDSIAVSYFAGHDHYVSALKFDLPDVPEGEEVVSFQLYLPVAQPSGDFSSPAFRDVITSVMLTISDQDPAAFVERLVEALQNDPLETDNDFLRMEACALTQPFEPSDAPQTQDAEEDLPREEPFEEGELGEPAVDCLLGGTGVLDEDGEHWVFDLTFAVDAWASGENDNHGILISPAGVPNLAFGDPDSTTFAQIALDVTGATATLDTEEPPPPIEGLGDEPGLDEPMVDEPADAAAPNDFDDAPAPSDAPSNGQDLDSPQVADDPEMSDEPAGAEPVDEPATAAPETQATTPAASASPSPWTWLLVPVFAGGAWLVTRSLTAPVTAAAAGGNAGAMSRLIESRGGPTVA